MKNLILKSKLKQGFTLVELLVVMAIIAILVTIGLASYTQANRSARDNKRQADIEVVRQALILYRSENGCYPAGLSNAFSSGNYTNVTGVLISDGFLSSPAPSDPGSNSYQYRRTGSTVSDCNGGYTGFELRAVLSDGTNHDMTNP